MENFICENCGAEHDGSYGSGRFCSKHCRFVYIGKQTKNHICNFNNGKNKNHHAPYGTWKCCHCDFIAETRKLLKDHKKECHPEFSGKSHLAWNKGLSKNISPIIAKSSKRLKERYKNGELVSFQKRKTYSKRTKNKNDEYIHQ